MARTKISEFSATPGNNTDIDGINIAEGCAPSGINDAIRELMSQLKDFQAGTAGDSFNGPVGTTTAAAGAFTTLSASSTVSGTGFSNYLASPPAIGGTAAAAGSFTTLSASSTVTLSGGTANGVLYLNGSKVATSGSALTFDGTNLASTTLSLAGSAAPTTANNERIAISNSYDATIQARYYGAPATNQKYLNAGWNLQTYGSGGAGYMTTGTNGIYSLSGGGQFISSADYTAFGALSANGFTNASPTFTEYMRLTSTGLGIGTSSFTAKLTSKASANTYTGGALALVAAVSGTSYLTNSGGALYVSNDGITDQLILSSAGNLGLGVTPSAWGLGKAFEIGIAGNCVWGVQSADLRLGANMRYDGSNYRYVNNGVAARYDVANGTLGGHAWYNAPSGTAGNAISFTQALTLNTNGALVLQGGDTSASGVGVTFPATQSASSDANTLDDYEEGTWTPRLYKNGVEITSPTSTVGQYIKIGKLVWVTAYFYKSSGTSATGGSWTIQNLPVSSGSVNYQVLTAGYAAVNSASFSSGAIRWQVSSGASIAEFYVDNTIPTTDWTTGFVEFSFTGCYQASA